MHTRNPFLGAIAGAAGGLAGSWTMVRFNHLLGGSEEDGGSHPHRRDEASPNDTDSSLPDEPASSQVASIALEPVVGRPLTEREKELTGPIFHYAFGAAVGAIYGATAEMQPQAAKAAGLPFGAAVWIVADEIGMPASGLARRPDTYPPSRHVSSFASHLVFGLTVEAIRRAFRGKKT